MFWVVPTKERKSDKIQKLLVCDNFDQNIRNKKGNFDTKMGFLGLVKRLNQVRHALVGKGIDKPIGDIDRVDLHEIFHKI